MAKRISKLSKVSKLSRVSKSNERSDVSDYKSEDPLEVLRRERRDFMTMTKDAEEKYIADKDTSLTGSEKSLPDEEKTEAQKIVDSKINEKRNEILTIEARVVWEKKMKK